MTLIGIERSNQGHLVFIGLCIILNVLLNSGAVRLRGLLFIICDYLIFFQLASDAANAIAMTDDEKKRVQELLTDIDTLAEVPQDDSSLQSVSI